MENLPKVNKRTSEMRECKNEVMSFLNKKINEYNLSYGEIFWVLSQLMTTFSDWLISTYKDTDEDEE